MHAGAQEEGTGNWFEKGNSLAIKQSDKLQELAQDECCNRLVRMRPLCALIGLVLLRHPEQSTISYQVGV